MADFTLEAKIRTVKGKKVGAMRREGIVPGTLYGPSLEPVSVQFPYRTLELALMKAGGTNLIDLKLSDGKSVPVLARYVQRDVLRGDILHVDFYAVDMHKKIRTEVPIVLMGESPAVQMKKGMLMSGTNTVSIEVLPSELLHQIEVDLSSLVEVGDHILVKDIKVGPSVTILSEPEELVAKVLQTSAARADEEAEAEEETGAVEPEVIHKGKQEEED